MTSLEKYLKNKEYYDKLFHSWTASEQHIDEDHDIWTLQSPEYKNQFVKMYRDGRILVIYGDYGNLIFDRMTWDATPHNLAYNSVGYQMEKLSHESRDSINVYDDENCRKDIIKWFKEQIENKYQICDKLYDRLFSFLEEDLYTSLADWLEYDMQGEFENDPDFDEITDDAETIKDLVTFVSDALEHTDEYEWISFLRSSSAFDDFDDIAGSNLWNAGKSINQRFYINLYAMYILSEKLKQTESYYVYTTDGNKTEITIDLSNYKDKLEKDKAVHLYVMSHFNNVEKYEKICKI